jgi:hypothetical protein
LSIDAPDWQASKGPQNVHVTHGETVRDRLIAAFEIELMLEAWLLERPGAEAGDGPGVPMPLEKFR